MNGMGNKREKNTEKYAKEFLSIIQHTHVTIKKLLETKNYTHAMNLLEQCQSYAISLGQQIESVEGESSAIIILLEDYCELVYQIYEKLRCFLPVDPNNVHNSLAMQLIRIGNSIKDNNP